MIAVADIGQLFSHFIIVITLTEAERGQGNAGFTLVGDQGFQHFRIRDTDIEIAIGSQNDAVDAIADEIIFRNFVGELDALAAIGRTTGLQFIECLQNACLVVATGGRQH